MTPRAEPRLALRAAVLLLGAALSWVGAAAAASPAQRVQLRVFRFVDHSRRAEFRNGTSGPRVLMTEVRYPTRGHGPFPLIVFAHGFIETPDVYARLLDAWVEAGYVVAAPVFPVESPNAPGGPSESDLANEPGDLSFVISQLTAPANPLRRLINSRKIAIAGQSDGAEAALSVAYDSRYRDRRIDAAIVMSGGAFPGFSQPPPGSPPLLAVQGTNDPLNSPSTTTAYYSLMQRPKFLLWLVGAAHLEPYTTTDRWAGVVDRATTAFLGHYLDGAPLRPLIDAGTLAGVARITSDP
jgi:dienelactone hydrolase